MLYFARGSITDKLSKDDLRHGLFAALKKLGARNRVLAVPPDFTRFHSQAGLLTSLVHEYYGDKLTDVLPALGTHTAMTSEQIHEMFAGVPENLFRVHNWRTPCNHRWRARYRVCCRSSREKYCRLQPAENGPITAADDGSNAAPSVAASPSRPVSRAS